MRSYGSGLFLFCYEGKVQEITVREEESRGVEEEESGKALRRIFMPREGKRAKT